MTAQGEESGARAAALHAQFHGFVPYSAALALMQQMQHQRIEDQIPDTMLYLEHEPIITYGRSTHPSEFVLKPDHPPLLEVPRGGQATYHGPGQLIGYGIVNLRGRPHGLRPDVGAYIRAIETGLIDFVRQEFKIPAQPRCGHTGVWVGPENLPRKIASIGISARRWVTSHGFALNVDPNLCSFESIVPCGDPDCEITSIAREISEQNVPIAMLKPHALAPKLHAYLTQALQESGFCQGDFV